MNLNVKKFGSEGPLPAPPRPQHTTAGIVIRPVVKHSRGRRVCRSPGTALVWRGGRMQLKAILLNFMGYDNFHLFCSLRFALVWSLTHNWDLLITFHHNEWDITAVRRKGFDKYFKSEQIKSINCSILQSPLKLSKQFSSFCSWLCIKNAKVVCIFKNVSDWCTANIFCLQIAIDLMCWQIYVMQQKCGATGILSDSATCN